MLCGAAHCTASKKAIRMAAALFAFCKEILGSKTVERAIAVMIGT